MTISQLARRAGVRDSAIRFYERQGLLEPTGRTPANYRWYGPEAVERLHFIRNAQASGFALEDVRALLDASQTDRDACTRVRHLIRERLDRVRVQLQRLKQLERSLAAQDRNCQQVAARSACPVLERLSTESARRA